MNCSVVVRAYNEARHIGRLLEGLASQTVVDQEIILVDSGSTDATIEIARRHGARVVQIPPQAFSFGRSLNLGLQAASRDLVVIASAHVYPVYPDWLEHLLAPFEDENVALVYGKQRGGAASAFSERQIFRRWFPDADSARQDNPFCNNANAAIRRTLWKQNAYDEELTGLEDIAWAKWAQSQGHHIAYSAHAEIIHTHHESPRRVYERYRREAMAFKRIFPESHFSAYDFVRLTFSNIFSDLNYAVRESMPLPNAASVFWFRAMQFWGTYQGYRNSGAVTQQLRQTFYYPAAAGLDSSGGRAMDPIRYEDAGE